MHRLASNLFGWLSDRHMCPCEVAAWIDYKLGNHVNLFGPAGRLCVWLDDRLLADDDESNFMDVRP